MVCVPACFAHTPISVFLRQEGGRSSRHRYGVIRTSGGVNPAARWLLLRHLGRATPEAHRIRRSRKRRRQAATLRQVSDVREDLASSSLRAIPPHPATASIGRWVLLWENAFDWTHSPRGTENDSCARFPELWQPACIARCRLLQENALAPRRSPLGTRSVLATASIGGWLLLWENGNRQEWIEPVAGSESFRIRLDRIGFSA